MRRTKETLNDAYELIGGSDEFVGAKCSSTCGGGNCATPKVGFAKEYSDSKSKQTDYK